MLDLSNLDCRQVVERELGTPPRRSGKNHIYHCPFHHGKKWSFTVDARGWRCWADCNESGDAISFIRKLKGYDFRQACAYLDVGQSQPTTRTPKPVTPTPEPIRSLTAEPPDQDWQAKTGAIVEMGHFRLAQALDTRKGDPLVGKVLAYLEKRGFIQPELFRRFQVGILLPSDGVINWRHLGAKAAITLPAFDSGTLWNVRLRLLGCDQRYWTIPGGKLRGSLFGAHEVSEKTLIIDEGEFNALSVNLIYGGKFDVQAAALGSASNRLDLRLASRLLLCRRIFARLDEDQAGQACLAHLQTIHPAIIPIRVPKPHKDMNDFFVADHRGFIAWLEQLNVGQVDRNG